MTASRLQSPSPKALVAMQTVAQEWIDHLPELVRRDLVLARDAVARVLVQVPPQDQAEMLDLIYEERMNSGQQIGAILRLINLGYSTQQIVLAYQVRAELTTTDIAGLSLKKCLALQRLYRDCDDVETIVTQLRRLRDYLVSSTGYTGDGKRTQRDTVFYRNFWGGIAHYAMEMQAHTGLTELEAVADYLDELFELDEDQRGRVADYYRHEFSVHEPADGE